MATLIEAPKGLEGVVVAETSVGDVRGDEGFFHYRGYAAPDLARSRTVEDVWYLLHRERLPTPEELRAFTAETAALRTLSGEVAAALPVIAREGTPMAALRTLVSLAGQDAPAWLDVDGAAHRHAALTLVATTPVLAAALWQARQGRAPLVPDPALGLAADYFRMLTGRTGTPQEVRALERYLLLTIDHGFNASTFTARVVTSTGADFTAAVVAAIGALSGPLHGGAPGRVLEMLTEIGTRERALAWVEQALASGRRIMGFGHRVYRTEDPRSALLKETALEIGGPVVDLAVEVERIVLDVLQRRYPERNLRTNVEYYAGVVLHLIGLPADMFSPTFAVSRMIGWTAHMLEQTTGNRIVRPASRYVGPVA